MNVHNPTTWDAEAGGSGAWSQPVVQSENLSHKINQLKIPPDKYKYEQNTMLFT